MELLKNWFGKKGIEYHEQQWDVKSIGKLVVPETLTHKNAFLLTNSVPELFFPVDFVADRVSKVRYYIADLKGTELPNSELNRFLGDINPLFSFADMVYNYAFSLNSDGNGYHYLSFATAMGSEPSPNNITRWDLLQPNFVDIDEYNNLSMLDVNSVVEFVKRARYCELGAKDKGLELSKLFIDNASMIRRPNYQSLSQGLLWKANKSIDTLLAVYSARYNVYANNGAAGYLAKKGTSGAAGEAMAAAMGEDNKREEILKDINSRNGVTGKRNLWGISGVPIEFVKTLATISELLPFEETLESSIKIASAFQIPPVLVPRKDQSTFDNQAAAEKSVWENALLSQCQTVCDNLTKLFQLNKAKAKIMFDASNVSALVANEKDNEELIKLQLDNIAKMREIAPGANIDNMINEMIKRYETRK